MFEIRSLAFMEIEEREGDVSFDRDFGRLLCWGLR